MHEITTLLQKYPAAGAGITAAGAFGSFIETFEPVVQFASAAVALVVGLITAFVTIRGLLRKDTRDQGAPDSRDSTSSKRRK